MKIITASEAREKLDELVLKRDEDAFNRLNGKDQKFIDAALKQINENIKEALTYLSNFAEYVEQNKYVRDAVIAQLRAENYTVVIQNNNYWADDSHFLISW